MILRKYSFLLLFATFIALSFLACDTAQNTDIVTVGSGQPKVVPVVSVEKPINRKFETSVSITGNLEANQKVLLFAMESGYLQGIKKDIGDRVAAGEVIARLVNPELMAELKQAEAKVKQAEALLIKAHAEIRSKGAEAKMKASYFNRLKKIYDRTPDLITIMELEIAQADSAISYANYEFAKAGPATAEAMMESAEAVKGAYQARIDMLEIRAPFSGLITKRLVDNGAVIQNGMSSNASPIMEIQDISKVILVIQYPESDIQYVKVGGDLNVRFPELRNRKLSGKISRISGALNPQSKTIRVEVDMPNTDRSLKPGMYAKVLSVNKNDKPRLSISTQAITKMNNELFVYKVEKNIVKKVPVSLGVEDRKFIELTGNGITAKDLIIVQGKGLVNEGMEVNAKLKK